MCGPMPESEGPLPKYCQTASETETARLSQQFQGDQSTQLPETQSARAAGASALDTNRFPFKTRIAILGCITLGGEATRFATLKKATDAAGSWCAALWSFER